MATEIWLVKHTIPYHSPFFVHLLQIVRSGLKHQGDTFATITKSVECKNIRTENVIKKSVNCFFRGLKRKKKQQT